MRLLLNTSRNAGSRSADGPAGLQRATRFAFLILGALLPLAHPAAGQTEVDLRTQSKDVDFSGAVTTKPAKTGTVLPPTCSAGEIFFQLNASAGQNLYLCTNPNTWT